MICWDENPVILLRLASRKVLLAVTTTRFRSDEWGMSILRTTFQGFFICVIQLLVGIKVVLYCPSLQSEWIDGY